MSCVIGDCRESMYEMVSQGVKVQMCVTSPPFWGLRDYGVSEQLGMEKTPAEYAANLVSVFSLVRDLLADDGTLWLNLGDSYGSHNSGLTVRDSSGGVGAKPRQSFDLPSSRTNPGKHAVPGMAKQLMGIPWRVAFALQADGWILRSDIIWSKPNPMPESVTDRPTKAHEYLFLLSKNARYYYDAAAIAEPGIEPERQRNDRIGGANGHLVRHSQGAMMGASDTRNRRSVWTFPNANYTDAHFATFPPALVEPCVAAGSRPGDTVLDPFFGSGTVGEVCNRLGRKWIGCEINPDYQRLQDARTAQQGLVFT